MSESPRYLADFDSAAAMARAVACSLRGEVFRNIGMASYLAPVAAVANRLPRRGRQTIYSLGGWLPAVRARRIQSVDPEAISRWVCGIYPPGRRSALMVGSSNGAATHLATALGAPWLPQTWLIPIRHPAYSADDAGAALNALKPLGLDLIERNPDLVLHHMHDPNQDRLMIRFMSYFRIKRRRLGQTYEAYIEETLPPAATIIIVDCGLSWPATTVAPRYFFQHGGAGGLDTATAASPEGARRVAEHFDGAEASLGSPPPAADTIAPEAEWGFLGEFEEDLLRFAGSRCRLVRLQFDDPEDLSPFVADLLAWWYERCGRTPDTLLVDSFILQEPGLARRMWAVPFWSQFSIRNSLEAAESYVSERPPFERIGIALFAHGVESVGFASPADWWRLLRKARSECALLGVDVEAYPADLAVYFRYARALESFLPSCLPPPRLPIEALQSFAEERGAQYGVRWTHLN